jgi:hypothetical protein
MTDGGPNPVQQGKAAFDTMNGHARLVPTIVFHGTADRVVNPINGDQVVQQWMETNRLASNNAYRPSFEHPSTVDNTSTGSMISARGRWPSAAAVRDAGSVIRA